MERSDGRAPCLWQREIGSSKWRIEQEEPALGPRDTSGDVPTSGGKERGLEPYGDNASHSAQLGRGSLAWCDYASDVGNLHASEGKAAFFLRSVSRGARRGFHQRHRHFVFDLLAAWSSRVPVFQSRCSTKL